MTQPTLIATDDTLKTVYSRNLPVLLYLHDGEARHKTTTDAAYKLAKKQGDALAVASLDVSANPITRAKYAHLALPALVILERKPFGMREKAAVGGVRPSDLRDYAAYLLGTGADPAERAAKQPAPTPQKKASSAALDVNEAGFKAQVLKSKTPVMVDFWAPWCAPCRQVSPVVEQLGEANKGKLRVVKVNVDENPALSRKYNVMSIPAIMIFKDGAVVESTVGAQPRHILQRMIDNALQG